MTVRTLRNIDVAAREAIEGGEPGVHVHPVRIQDLPKSFQLCLDSVLLCHELLQRKLGFWHSIRVAPRGRSRRDGWRVNVVHHIGRPVFVSKLETTAVAQCERAAGLFEWGQLTNAR